LKNRYTGYRDRSGKCLYENDRVVYLYPFVKSWMEGKIIFKDDIPRVAHKYATEILNADIVKDIKKTDNKQYGRMSLERKR